jgi:TonB family protein
MRRRLAVALVLLALASPRALADDYAACGAPGVTPPKAANQHIAGDYPVLSVMLREQGTTTLGFIIKEDGTPASVTVVNSSGSLRLDDASVEAVTKAWRYKPAMSADGKPLACPWKAKVLWILHDDAAGLPPGVADIAIRMKPEDYPPEARRHGEQGSVTVMVVQLEGVEGRLALVVESSGYPDLDDAAARIVKERLKLTAAEFDGKPVPTMAIVVVVWSLEPENPPAAPPKER